MIWYYTTLEYSIQVAVFGAMYAYIARQQNTVDQYIVTLPILDLCLEVELRL